MNESPNPAFVDALEWHLRSELRRRAEFRRRASFSVSRVARTAILLAGAMVVGAGGVVAAQHARTRDRRELEIARVEVIAQAASRRRTVLAHELDEMEKRRGAGLVSDAEVEALRVRIVALDTDVARATIDRFEVAETGEPPRTDLAAPRVGGRDLVRERLELERAGLAAQRRALGSETIRIRSMVEAGMSPSSDLEEAETSERVAQLDLRALDACLDARVDYLAGKISAERADLLASTSSVEARLQSAALRLDAARRALEQTRARAANGIASRAEVSEAESAVDALETERRLQEVEAQILAERLGR